MSFEQMLRDQLQREADVVPLPMREPDQAVDRARARRRNLRIGQAAIGGLAVAITAAVVVPRTLGDATDDVSVASPQAGLVPTGPLELTWQTAEGGLSYVTTTFQGDDGTLYALSTGPGARSEDYPDGDTPRALYRLAEDGSWEPIALDGGRPRAIDVASGDGLLYAVSTGPAGGGDGVGVRLSTSADGGDTWSSDEVDMPDPPSTAGPWNAASTTSIEGNGSTTLASVTTSFFPDTEHWFPEMADDESLGVEARDEGLVLIRYGESGMEVEESGAAVTTPPTRPEDPEGSESVDVELQDEVVRTVTWAELGVDGPEALNGHTQLYQWADGSWAPVDIGGQALADLSSVDLQVAGDRFVASGWSGAYGGDEERGVTLTSTDGASWTPVSAPGDGSLVTVGPALVEIPYEGSILHVSGDGGVTWNDVDLADAGLSGDAYVANADGGPLGLALVIDHMNDTDGADELIVSGDLIDWTSTPLAEVVGMDQVGEVTPVVGADRIAITATEPPDDDSSSIPGSVTAVGTPVRDG